MQKEKEEVKLHCDSLQKEKAKTERQLEDTSSQVHTHYLVLVQSLCDAIEGASNPREHASHMITIVQSRHFI